MTRYITSAGLLAALTGTAFTAAPVQAAELSAAATAEIRKDGPRLFSGNISNLFFNISGDDDDFATFGVADFDTSGVGPLPGIAEVTLSLTQDNAGFSTDGPIKIFLATDTREITPTDAAVFIPTGTDAAAVGTAFGTLYELGSGNFTVDGDGEAEVFTLDLGLTAGAEAFFLSQINSGSTLRLIVTPSSDSVAATYGGFSNDVAPLLSITAIPEPTSLLIFGAATGVLALRRRRSA